MYSDSVKQETRSTSFREHSFLRWLREKYGAECHEGMGIGDDAAWRPERRGEGSLWAMDTVVEGVHVDTCDELELAERLGRKAVLVNLSDIAAMGGVPDGALLSIALPERMGQSEAEGCARAAAEACRKHGIGLIGGDTVTTKGPMIVTVAISGYSTLGVVSRAGAKDGDVIVVTGTLGGSLYDGRHGDFEPCLSEAFRLMEIAAPHSMTDISDGLTRDLSNILEASGVGAVIDSASIPIHPSACSLSEETGRPALWHALNDGEDFELLFTMDSAAYTRVQSQWNLPKPLTVIGCIEGEGLLLAEGQQRTPLLPGGFEHGVE